MDSCLPGPPPAPDFHFADAHNVAGRQRFQAEGCAAHLARVRQRQRLPRGAAPAAAAAEQEGRGGAPPAAALLAALLAAAAHAHEEQVIIILLEEQYEIISIN